MTYLLDIPGLASAVERAAVTPKHSALLQALRKFEPLEAVNFSTMRDGIRLHRRKVLTASGDIVADDHEKWLEEQVATDNGRFDTTAARLRALGYRLSECSLEQLYFIADRGGPHDNFIQVEIELHHERVERRMFYESGGWRRLENLDDLVREAEDGSQVPKGEQLTIGRDGYHLDRVIDVRAFMADAEALKAAEHLAQRQRTIRVTDMQVGPGAQPPVQRHMTLDEINPAAKDWVWPARRLFDDWAASSAGRDGHRLSDHWALQIRDYTSPQGRRDVSVIPLWTHTRKMAKIESAPNVHTLFGKLQSIDSRRRADFAWYFYMLHGNLVQDWAGERILKAAEEGLIVLPEHDYQVLRRWQALPYGF